MDNPWIGLCSYQEGRPLFGRDVEIRELSSRIQYNTQMVMYGKSGIGKSSIINAGVFPRLREENILPMYVRLRHNDIPYTQQIIEIIEQTAAEQHCRIESVVPHPVDEENKPIFKETMWEYLHRTRFYNEREELIQPLIVFDQFEEIFTLTKETKQVLAFFEEIGDLINNIKPQVIIDYENSRNSERVAFLNEDKGDEDTLETEKKGRIATLMKRRNVHRSLFDYTQDNAYHIVFTLREDFLSYFERYTNGIPLLKQNRYCLQALNEEQAAEIILKPCPGLVSIDVAKLIISKVAGTTNFELDGISEIEVDAAVLSLYLSRLYEEMEKRAESFITKELVEQASTNIIEQFYDDCIRRLSEKKQEELEYQLLTANNRRDNISRSDFLNLGFTEEEIRYLVEDVKLLRQFSMRDDLRLEFIHDILCPVVKERREQRELLKQQEREREIMEEERRIQQEKLFQAERAAVQLRQKNRTLWLSVISFVFILALVFLLFIDGLYVTHQYRYEAVVKNDGWFVGRGELSLEEASYRTTYYVLFKKGRWARHAYKIEARDGYGRLTINHSLAPYILNQFDDSDKGADEDMRQILLTVCQWEMIPDRSGNFVVQERALDKDGKIIFCYNRNRQDDTHVISMYADEMGFPLMFRDSNYFYLRTTYQNGYEVLTEFYDDKGFPITNKDSAYQTQRVFLSNGVQDAEFSLFFDGRRMVDRVANCGWRHLSYLPDSIHPTMSINLDDHLEPCKTSSGVAVVKYEYDTHHRIIRQTYLDKDLNPASNNDGVHEYILEYNRYGSRTHMIVRDTLHTDISEEISKFDEYGHLVDNESKNASGIEIYHAQYDINECVFSEFYSLVDGDTIWDHVSWRDADGNTHRKEYYQQYIEYTIRDSHDNQISCSYFSADEDTPILCPWDGFHKKICNYTYMGDSLTRFETSYLDEKGVLLNSNKIIIVDSINKFIDYLEFIDNSFNKGYRHGFGDHELSILIYEESINAQRKVVRYYGNNAFYYRSNIICSIKPSMRNAVWGMYGENEFGEPSLVYSSGNLFYALRFSDNYYWSPSHTRMTVTYNDIPLLAYIETSLENTLDFEDGDIVLACNDWIMDFDNENPLLPFYDINWWDSIERDFVVARFNELKNMYDVKHIKVDSLIDINQHVRFKKFRCTEREKKRIESIIYSSVKPIMLVATVQSDSCSAYHQDFHRKGAIIAINDKIFTHSFSTDEFDQWLETLSDQPKDFVVYDFDDDVVKILHSDGELLGISLSVRPVTWGILEELNAEYEMWLQHSAENY